MFRRMLNLTLTVFLLITCFSVAKAQRKLILSGRTSPDNPVNNYYFTDDDYAHFGIELYEDGTFSMSEMHWESVYFHEGRWDFTGDEIILSFSDGAHILGNSIKIRDGKGYTWFCQEEVEVNLPRDAFSFLQGEPEPVQTTTPADSSDDRWLPGKSAEREVGRSSSNKETEYWLEANELVFVLDDDTHGAPAPLYFTAPTSGRIRMRYRITYGGPVYVTINRLSDGNVEELKLPNAFFGHDPFLS